jgi:hypothetical protein
LLHHDSKRTPETKKTSRRTGERSSHRAPSCDYGEAAPDRHDTGETQHTQQQHEARIISGDGIISPRCLSIRRAPRHWSERRWDAGEARAP